GLDTILEAFDLLGEAVEFGSGIDLEAGLVRAGDEHVGAIELRTEARGDRKATLVINAELMRSREHPSPLCRRKRPPPLFPICLPVLCTVFHLKPQCKGLFLGGSGT